MKEDWYRKAYGPSAAKTYETSLFNLITTEFGYIGGPDVVKLFAKKIVELNNQYYHTRRICSSRSNEVACIKGRAEVFKE